MKKGFKIFRSIKMSLIMKRLNNKWKGNFKVKIIHIKELDKLTFYVKVFANRFSKAAIGLKLVLRELDMKRNLSRKRHHQKRHLTIHLNDLLFLTNTNMGNLKDRLKRCRNGIHTLILLILITRSTWIWSQFLEIKVDHLPNLLTNKKENITLYKRHIHQKLITFHLLKDYLLNLKTLNYLNRNYQSTNRKTNSNLILRTI